MSDKRAEFEQKAKAAMSAVLDVIREARAEGYAVECSAMSNMDGQPSTRVVVTLR